MNIHYRALAKDGSVVEQTVEGKTRFEVIADLRKQGLTIIDLREEQPGPGQTGPKPTKLEFFGISHSAITFFTRQFSELLDAGFPLVECLNSIQRFTTNSRMSAVIGDVSSAVQKGQSLSAALGRHPEAFDQLYLSLIKVGEATGNLPGMLSRLADYFERDMDVREKVRAALTYPAFILTFSMALVYAMVSFLLPSFEPMWKSSGMNLDNYPITLFLMKLSALTHNVFDELLLGIGLAVVGFLFVSYTRTPEGGRQWDRVLMHLPIFGSFMTLSVSSRVCATLATLLESGSAFLPALELTAGVANNRVISDALLQAARDVAGGEKLGVAFRKHDQVFPALMLQMVAMGEESGHLDSMLTRTARYYESQLNSLIKSFSSLVEPIMMVIIGGVVFVFVLGVMMPIMGIVAALQAHM